MRLRPAMFLWLALVSLTPARAAQGPIRAARSPVPPHLDGKVDELAWKRAPVYTEFVESFPQEGAAAADEFRTEVRVLYDDRTLYVSVVCHDPQPSEIVHQLARRDSPLAGDMVEVWIDSTHDRRSGVYFAVNAAGVLRDGLLYGDVNLTDTWDGVWDAAVSERPDGWSVELAIPLELLRFPRVPTQEWGFLIRRTVYRTHQVLDSQLIPRSANGLVSRLGTLAGLDGLVPRRAFQLTPYATTRLTFRPQYTDPATPQPRLSYPSADVGLDLRAAVASDLTLVAALNPDFGQVEADQVVLNVSNQELFFPEKRPFFNEGLDLFQPVGDEYGAPQRLFYSRRIGLDAPILAAAKLTGTGWKGLDLGILDAVVTGVADPGKADVAYLESPAADDAWVHQVEQSPDRHALYAVQRPFHLGLAGELPAAPPVPRNYLGAVLRQSVLSASTVGATLTSANPLGPRCTQAQVEHQKELQAALPTAIRANSADPILFDPQTGVNDCEAYGGTTAGLDMNLRSSDGEWLAIAAVNASRRIGGPANDVQYDGTVIHPGDLGAGGYLYAGKYGGEGFRWNVAYRYASPRLDLNAVGFLATQNEQGAELDLHYYRSRDIGALHELQLSAWLQGAWTADGAWTTRGRRTGVEGLVTLAGFQSIGLDLSWELPRYDVREVRQYGVPFERRGSVGAYLFGNTDPKRKVVLSGEVYLLEGLVQGPVPAQLGGGADLTLLVRPWSWWETQLTGKYDAIPLGARYIQCLQGPCSAAGVDSPESNTFLFGQRDAETLSLTLRQSFIFTPRLTLQVYAQLFSAGYHHPAYFSARASTGEQISMGSLTPLPEGLPAGASNPDFHDAALNINVVFRWEYQLGSILYLVYVRSQSVLGLQPGQTPTSGLTPLRLGPGPTVDTFQVKWSYFFDL